MTEIITKYYQCDLCGKLHDTEREAYLCERKGDTTGMYPVGLMYAYYIGSNLIGIFAICAPGTQFEHNKHLADPVCWAIRRHNGNSLGPDVTGYPHILTREIPDDFLTMQNHLASPEAKQMIEYLRQAGITPRYYTPTKKLVEL